jgi:23S rRNA (guanosine2251-2'-O)-methyltransferase
VHDVSLDARKAGIAVRYVTSELLDRTAGTEKHQGVVAKVKAYAYALFSDLLKRLPSSEGNDWVLALDGVTDPRNLGALLRTAEGVGIRHVVIPQDRSVGITSAVAKTSAGALHYLRIYRVVNLRRAIRNLKEKGYWVIGLDAEAEEVLYRRQYPNRLVIVMGAEGTGIRPLIQKECDFLVSIPMRGSIASLNVAVAAGVFLFELLRQRMELQATK